MLEDISAERVNLFPILVQFCVVRSDLVLGVIDGGSTAYPDSDIRTYQTHIVTT